MLAEQLTKENRQDEALEQLQKLHDRLDSEGREAEARATVDRMKSIDPEAVPRASGSHRPQKSSDLIFLDTSFEQSARSAKPAPAPAPRAPTPAAPSLPTPPGRQISDPDLVALTLGDEPDVSALPLESVALTDGLDLVEPNAVEEDALPLLDVGDALPDADELAPAFDVNAAASIIEPSALQSILNCPRARLALMKSSWSSSPPSQSRRRPVMIRGPNRSSSWRKHPRTEPDRRWRWTTQATWRPRS